MSSTLRIFWISVGLLTAFRFFGPEADVPSRGPRPDFPGWPASLVPQGGSALPASDVEWASWGAATDVQKVFVRGDETWLLRWLAVAERSAHPAEDCFRATGHRLTEARLVEEEGLRWREFIAEKNGQRWRVRQRWVGTTGETWTDVSAWFWAARRGSLSAWSQVIVTPEKGTG